MTEYPCAIAAFEASPHHPAPAINDPALASLIGASVSPNTRRVYRGTWARLDTWLAGRVLDDSTLAAWITHLHGQGLSTATAALAVASTRFRARWSGRENPVGPMTEHTLAGIRRSSIGRGRGQVSGVTWERADAVVVAAMREGTLRGLRDAALIAVASDALLRVGEVVAVNWADLDRDPDGSAVLHVRRAKSDQEGVGATCYLGARTVAVLDAWLRRTGIGGDGRNPEVPVFRSVRKGGGVGGRLSDRSARAIITARCESLIPGRVSGHSLRVGSAMSLARAGASLVELQQAGRWKSPEMPARYTRGESARLGAVARLRYGAETAWRMVATDGRQAEARPIPVSEEQQNRSGATADSRCDPCAELGSRGWTPGI